MMGKLRNRRQIEDKYCVRGAEWGVGDCSAEAMSPADRDNFVSALKQKVGTSDWRRASSYVTVTIKFVYQKHTSFFMYCGHDWDENVLGSTQQGLSTHTTFFMIFWVLNFFFFNLFSYRNFLIWPESKWNETNAKF